MKNNVLCAYFNVFISGQSEPTQSEPTQSVTHSGLAFFCFIVFTELDCKANLDSVLNLPWNIMRNNQGVVKTNVGVV